MGGGENTPPWQQPPLYGPSHSHTLLTSTDKQQQTFSTLTDEVLVSETVSSSKATDSEPCSAKREMRFVCACLAVSGWAEGPGSAWERGNETETGWNRMRACGRAQKNLNYRAEAINLHMKQAAEFRREACCWDLSEIGISNLLSDISHLASTVSNIYTHMCKYTHTHNGWPLRLR